jgi:hypothetical protein
VTRYPLQPLLDAIGADSLRDAADRLGTSVTSLRHYRDDGLTLQVADRLTIAAGLHPAMVWPSWVDDALTVVDRMFIESGGWRTAWLWQEEAA